MELLEKEIFVILTQPTIQGLITNKKEIQNFLSQQKIYFRIQQNNIFLDKYALGYLHQNKFCSKLNKETLEEIYYSDEYKIYDALLKKGFYIMSNSLFGCLFSVYKDFSLDDKTHSVFLVFSNKSDIIQINRVATILKKKCVLAVVEHNSVSFFLVERC